MKVLVLGSSGLLGSRLVPHLRTSGHEVVPVSRSGRLGCAVDLLETGALSKLVAEQAPQAVINLAALADVDACQRDPELAAAMNARLPGELADLCRAAGISLVHISTDMVYDGPGPHTEDDAHARNVYASTKQDGDRLVLEAGGCSLRTNFFGRSLHPERRSFSDWLVEGFRAGRELPLLQDVFFSPLGMDTLSRMVERVLAAPPGGSILNLGSREGLGKRDFALRLARRCGFGPVRERAVTLASLGLAAPRPLDMRMDVARFEAAFHTILPDLDAEIGLVAQEYA